MYSKLLFLSIRSYRKSFVRHYSKPTHPFHRTWNIVSNEIGVFFGLKQKKPIYPEHADIVIIGGGPIGSSAAYWLKERAGRGLTVVVLDKDETYRQARNKPSTEILTQHYSLPENILLSKFSAEFMRNISEYLNKNVDLQYHPTSSLVLASEKYVHKMEENVAIMKEHGVKNEILLPDEIKMQYPWINTDDVKLGCRGLESEGVFNSWALLKGMVEKAIDLGAIYVNAEVTGFELEKQRDMLMEGVPAGSFERINKIHYKTPDNEEYSIKFAMCVLASQNSEEIAKHANIGIGKGLLEVALPVKLREHKVCSVEDTKPKGLNTPVILDSTGLWIRKSGFTNNLICSQIPILEDSKLTEDEYMQQIFKPSVLNRVPGLQNSSITNLMTEVYDHNTYDDSGILGPHSYHVNLLLATGFGKQGVAQSPAIGRAISEIIIDSQYMNIDLTRFGFDRLFTYDSVIESNVY